MDQQDFRRMILPGSIKRQVDDAVGNSKSFAVPTGKTWQLFEVYVEHTSTVTAGNRQLEVQLLDGSTVIARVRAGAVQAASLTNFYAFGPDLPRETAFVVSMLHCPLPMLMAEEGWTLKVFDSANIAAADTCKVRFSYAERDKV